MLFPSDCGTVAVNCWVAPMGRLGFGGVILTREVPPEKKGKPKSRGPLQDVRYNAKVARINPLTIRPLETDRIFSAPKFTPANSPRFFPFAKPLWNLRMGPFRNLILISPSGMLGVRLLG